MAEETPQLSDLAYLCLVPDYLVLPPAPPICSSRIQRQHQYPWLHPAKPPRLVRLKVMGSRQPGS